MPILIIYLIAIVIFVKKMKEKISERPTINYDDTFVDETPEQYLQEVYNLGKNAEAEQLEKKIMEFRDEQYHSEGLKPLISRDETILREELKEFRHSQATGMAREDQSVFHKPFRLSELKEPLTKEEHDSMFHQPLAEVVEVVESSDLNLFGNSDEMLKSFIYHEVLSKPKSSR